MKWTKSLEARFLCDFPSPTFRDVLWQPVASVWSASVATLPLEMGAGVLHHPAVAKPSHVKELSLLNAVCSILNEALT